jgi:hypothetical protein
MWHAWGRRIKHVGFWWKNMKKRNHLEDLGVEGRAVELESEGILGGVGVKRNF